MDYDKEKQKISKFLKIGIVVMSSVLLLAVAVNYIPKAISVSTSSSKRELPIYCVDCKEKKVALSFDAAWGNGR